MDAAEAVLRAQVPAHVHEWRTLTQWAYREFRLCACGAHGIVRTHPYGVVIPDDPKEQA